MMKLIRFLDCNAIWSTKSINVPGHVCRKVEVFYLLPEDVYLEFNCTEKELSSSLDDPSQFTSKIKQFHIPEVKLSLNHS